MTTLMTPKQWEALRGMIIQVHAIALSSGDTTLLMRAKVLLLSTEGHDVQG